jgi:hypothetical protein
MRFRASLTLSHSQLAAPLLPPACVDALTVDLSDTDRWHAALAAFDRDSFATVECVVQMLALFRHSRPLIRDRVYARWALALTHATQYAPQMLRALHPTSAVVMPGGAASKLEQLQLQQQQRKQKGQQHRAAGRDSPATASGSSFITSSSSSAAHSHQHSPTLTATATATATICHIDDAEAAIVARHAGVARVALARSFFALDAGFSAAIAQSLTSPHLSATATPMARGRNDKTNSTKGSSFSFPPPLPPLPASSSQLGVHAPLALAATSAASASLQTGGAPYLSVLDGVPTQTGASGSSGNNTPQRKHSIASLASYLGAASDAPLAAMPALSLGQPPSHPNRPFTTQAQNQSQTQSQMQSQLQVQSKTHARSRSGSLSGMIAGGGVGGAGAGIGLGAMAVISSFSGSETLDGTVDFERVMVDRRRGTADGNSNGNGGDDDDDDSDSDQTLETQAAPPLALLGTRPAPHASTGASETTPPSSSSSSALSAFVSLDTAAALSAMSDAVSRASSSSSSSSSGAGSASAAGAGESQTLRASASRPSLSRSASSSAAGMLLPSASPGSVMGSGASALVFSPPDASMPISAFANATALSSSSSSSSLVINTTVRSSSPAQSGGVGSSSPAFGPVSIASGSSSGSGGGISPAHQALPIPGIPADSSVARLAIALHELVAQWHTVAAAFDDHQRSMPLGRLHPPARAASASTSAAVSAPVPIPTPTPTPTPGSGSACKSSDASFESSSPRQLIALAALNRTNANHSGLAASPRMPSSANSSPPTSDSLSSAASALSVSPTATGVNAQTDLVESRTAELLLSLPRDERVRLLQRMLATVEGGSGSNA